MSYIGSITEAFDKGTGSTGVFHGITISRYLKLSQQKCQRIDFKIIKSDSKYLQAVVLGLSDFKGKVFIEGKKCTKPRGRFPKLMLWEDDIPTEFSVYTQIENGGIFITNGSTPFGKLFCTIYSGGEAINLQQLGENHYLLRCNDVEYDDDFEDLVFEVKILDYDNEEEWLKEAKIKPSEKKVKYVASWEKPKEEIILEKTYDPDGYKKKIEDGSVSSDKTTE